MTIQITKQEPQEIRKEIEELYQERKAVTSNLPKKTLNEVKNLFSNTSINKFLNNLNNLEFYDTFDYDNLSDTFEIAQLFYEKVKEIKKEVDIEIFFKDGYQLDKKKLKKQAKDRGILKEFPNFNIDRLAELYKHPPKTLGTYYNQGKEIIIDEYVYRKYLIGINQMIFNHMDLLVCGVGAEGAGKSNHISQDILMLYWTLKEIGVIDYKYEINEIAFNTLQKFREAEDKYFDEPFRLLWLDEGNELNRQDWRDDEVKTFFQRLRRERHNRRIKFISLPVLGELVVNIVLSRMNFIFEMINRNELTTATLHKGEYDFYVVPRGKQIYSPFYKKNISREEVKKALYANLKDKEYLKGMPKNIVVKKCYCNGVWGFKEIEYIKELKESNKTYTVSKGMGLSMMECFYLYKANISMKKLGIDRTDLRYSTIYKIINRANKIFEEDPEVLLRYESNYKRKLERKQENEDEPITSAPNIKV